ncbi:MAG: hypothetical protein EPO24_12295 [Bacteroidetes bacterium]|nr:MAG: hypothetical protein EPO24_12295 [Bacteroidota bacterium]
MKHFLLIVINILTLTIIVRAQVPQLITHQGYLADTSGQALNGVYPMAFRFFADSTGGSALLGQTFSGVQVTNGAYAVVLDVATLSFNKQLWLETEVFFETLTPRTRLTSVPYALTALSLLGPNSEATGIGTSAGGTNNRARGNYSVVSGGGGFNVSDSNSASGHAATIGGGSRNIVTGAWGTVSGGDYNIATSFISTVGGGFGNIVDGEGSTISGGKFNIAHGEHASISGGRDNLTFEDYSTISGGFGNEATAYGATIGGGYKNKARGEFSVVSGGGGNKSSTDSSSAIGDYSVVGGGNINLAMGNRSTVSGGGYNNARGNFSVVSGGGGAFRSDSNSAIGDYSTIPGGRKNRALGNYSFAAGWSAQANHDGTFVWADSAGASGTTFASTAPNQFLIRASGGVGIGTASPENTVHILKNSAGSVSATANAPLIVENNTSCFLHILSPAANEQGVLFGDPSSSISGGVVVNASNQMEFRAGGNSIRMTVDSDGDVGIGTTSPGGALDISSSSGALIVPRLTTSQRDAITPAAGMIIYNKTTGQFNFYEGGAWVTK